MNAKSAVEAVFSVPIAKRLWSANIESLLPVTPQNFSVAAVLPAVLYMFRWGQRRGGWQTQQSLFPNGARSPGLAAHTCGHDW